MRLRALKWLEITENSSRFIWAKSAGWCNIHFKKCIFIKIKNELPNKLWKGLQIQPYKPKMKSIKRNQPSSKLRKHQLEILTNQRSSLWGIVFKSDKRNFGFFLHLSTALLCSLWNWNWEDSECSPGRNHKQSCAFDIISEQMKANIILIAFHFAL